MKNATEKSSTEVSPSKSCSSSRDDDQTDEEEDTSEIDTSRNDGYGIKTNFLLNFNKAWFLFPTETAVRKRITRRTKKNNRPQQTSRYAIFVALCLDFRPNLCF